MPCRKTAWSDFTAEVLALYEAPLRRPATRRKMRQVLLEFGRLCSTVPDLSPATIARWIVDHPGRRPETVAALLRTLSAACTYGIHREYMQSDPFDFRSPTAWVDWDVPDLPPPVHTSAEIASVLALADQEAREGPWQAARRRAVVYTLAFTGARKREILGLSTADVDLEARTVVIRTNRRRGLKTRGSAATLPLPGPLADVLAGWTPLTGCEWLFPGSRRIGPWLEGPAGGKAIDEIEALGRRAGVAGLTIASFRHTFASLAESWQFSELALQRQLRHSTNLTQLAYRHQLPEVLRAAADRVHYEPLSRVAAPNGSTVAVTVAPNGSG